VIEKFLTQDETAANLTHLTKEAQSRIEALNEEKGLAKAKVEEMRYSGPGTFGSRRIVGESYAHADVCRRMLTYADVCRRMLTYADVC
jgi:hypothetical protein